MGNVRQGRRNDHTDLLFDFIFLYGPFLSVGAGFETVDGGNRNFNCSEYVYGIFLSLQAMI